MRGAEAVIRALEKEGVTYISGFSGGGLAPLWEPLRTSSIQVFSARHKRLGVEIADGYARATGTVGVAMTGTGPGATNTLTGIAACYVTISPCCYSWASTRCATLVKSTSKRCPAVFLIAW